jgi:glycosyltransferase involved in cell wall biosynthesis
MANPVRILYDASLLGIGYRNQSYSGLMRVAEQVLLSLLYNPDLIMQLCSSLSLDVWEYSRAYISNTPHMSVLPFLSNTSQGQIRVTCKDKLLEQCIRDRNPLHMRATWQHKLLLKLVSIGFAPLRRQDLKGIDLYHSPYHGFPRVVQKAKPLRRFLTVHDIIPLLYPDFFGLPSRVTAAHFDPEFNLLSALQGIDQDTWILCPSASTKNDLCTYFDKQVDPHKIYVTPWGASPLFYPCPDTQCIAATQRKYGIPDGPYILCLSTLEPRKNIAHVMRCFAHLVAQEKLPDVTLVLAGAPGWQYDALTQELTNFGRLAERIILTGYVADADLAPLYSGALVFVYLSFYEGFGLPPLEAMQCGTPVIASQTSSLP